MIVGGLTNNILAPSYVAKHHAEKVRNRKSKVIVKVYFPGFVFTCGPSQSSETVPRVHHQAQGPVQQGGGGVTPLTQEDCQDSLQLWCLGP